MKAFNKKLIKIDEMKAEIKTQINIIRTQLCQLEGDKLLNNPKFKEIWKAIWEIMGLIK